MIAGAFAGYEIDRYYFVDRDSHFGKTRFISYMTNELGLTRTQQAQLDSIVAHAHPKFQAIRKEFSTQLREEADSTQRMIKSILNPEQQVKFVPLIKQMRRDSR